MFVAPMKNVTDVAGDCPPSVAGDRVAVNVTRSLYWTEFGVTVTVAAVDASVAAVVLCATPA